ncbi:unnamed protein product [Calicophoron daubneyi]|uniref:Protein kinase domain-containing protein n=1 Tax=Calicophoron daubneyi TaxID=300641 RepID=A0AAV2T8G5_CALDB
MRPCKNINVQKCLYMFTDSHSSSDSSQNNENIAQDKAQISGKVDDPVGREGHFGVFTLHKGIHSLVELVRNADTGEELVIKWLHANSFLGRIFRQASLNDNTARTPNAVSSSEIPKEVSILKQIEHPNIVKLVRAIEEPNEGLYGLVMEYLKKGALQNIPDSYVFTSEQVWTYFDDILEGLDYRN